MRHSLVRSRDERIVGGVAAGLAHAWGWHAWLVRLAFVALTPLGGLGLVLYLAAWLFLPEEGAAESIAQRAVDGLQVRQSWIGFGLLIAGGLVVGAMANIDGAALLAGALLISGYALYRGDVFPIAQQPAVSSNPDGGEPVAVYRSAPRPRRPRSYLGRLTLGSMFITLGVMGALEAFGLARPTTRHYAAAALLVIGLGLLVGTVYGRSRGLVAFGILLLPFAALGAIADHSFSSSWSSIDEAPLTLGELAANYSVAAGDIHLDLSAIDFTGQTAEIEITTGVGNIHVIVPNDAAVSATAAAILGEASVGGRTSAGIGAEVERSLAGGAGAVAIDASARLGSVRIHRLPFDVPIVDRIDGLRAPVRPARVVVDDLLLLEPAFPGEIPTRIELNGGRLILDLSNVDAPDANVRTTITGSGSATVIYNLDTRIVASSTLPFEQALAASDTNRFEWRRPGSRFTLQLIAEGVQLEFEETP